MSKGLKKVIAFCMMGALLLAGCGSGNQTQGSVETETLNIAYQYGLGYAPAIIAQELGLIEKAYEEATGKSVTVVWNQMSSGADINTGISSGNLDVGFMGLSPAITGVVKNVGYKIFTNVAGQEHGLILSDSSIQSFDDLVGSEKQIAVVNMGSFQHIVLAMALEKAGYDAHALDSNMVVMKHPDAMTALENQSVVAHMSINPYIFQQREQENLSELKEVNSVWGVENTHIVGVASESLYNENPELYKALCEGLADAIDYINTDVEGAAEILCEYDGNTKEEEAVFLQKSKYMVETNGIYEIALFMARAGFIEKAPESYEVLVFDNVTGD